MIPNGLYGENVRKLLTPDMWEILRQDIFTQHNRKCVICTSPFKLECHEVWEYNIPDKNTLMGVQILKGFQTLCYWCHRVKHIGHTKRKSNGEYSQALNHLMMVNNIDVSAALTMINRASNLNIWRGLHLWSQDLSILKV